MKIVFDSYLSFCFFLLYFSGSKKSLSLGGSWQCDYFIFDKWVSFMIEQGISWQINCYSMSVWGNRYYYFDKNRNQEERIQAVPGTKEYSELWTPFLQDFKKHLKEKGWLEMTRIAMDERAPEEMKAVLKLLSDVVP